MKHFEQSKRVRSGVLGISIDVLDWQAALERIQIWASSRESRAVFLCNVHSIMTARRDPEFASAIERADLAAPDGAPIAWYLRMKGFAGQERISGPDLMWRCCERAAENGQSIFLYGSTPRTLEGLEARLNTDFPSLVIAGKISPPFRELTTAEADLIVHQINASGASIVWVALGCPKQELWINQNRERIKGVVLGVGAAFDFHSGMVRRAPKIFQRCGMEWFHRLIQEPRRLAGRYFITNTLFLATLTAAGLKRLRVHCLNRLRCRSSRGPGLY